MAVATDSGAEGQKGFVTDLFDPADYDFVLPAGVYLSYFYQGSYQQNRSRVQEVLAYAASHGLTLAGTPFELYEIDNRDTVQEAEFLTEIQVAISPASL